jgi:hypothetical protein
VRVCETGGATLLMNRYAEVVQLPAKGRALAYVFNYFPNALEQPRVVKERFSDGYTIPSKLSSVSHKTRSVR